MNNDKENAQFLRDSVDEQLVLPESLSKENITKLVMTGRQTMSKGARLRRFVAVGVAACVMVTVCAVLFSNGFDFSVFKPAAETAQDQTGGNTAGDASYDELLTYIKEYKAEYISNQKNIYNYAADIEEGFVTSDSLAPQFSSNNSAAVSTGSASASRGELNLREKDVYENDIFINDGEYLYYINEQFNIGIAKAEADGTLTLTAEIKKENSSQRGSNTSGLYKYKDYLIECCSEYYYNENYTECENRAGVNIYDVSDAENPVFVKNFSLDGHYSSSRIVDGRLILVGTYGITQYFVKTDDSLLLPATFNDGKRAVVPAGSIVCDKEEAPECYILVMTVFLDDLTKEAQVMSVLGHSTETYCTKETLYILGTSYSYRTYATGVVSSFFQSSTGNTTITALDITGEKAIYKNRTEIDGTILNSYSIDEYNGYLRMAVNKSDENLIVVLDKDFNKVGEISGIAKGELIKSARFMGNTAYVVTFVQTDPLFVIDLTEPSAPVIKGEVKLPGFSSYLHPVGEGLLVGIGVGGTESGIDGSAKISLFDVSDPCSPKEIDNFILENASISTDSKAYTSVSESSFLIPYTVWGNYINGYSDGRYRTGAMLMEIKDNELVMKTDYCARSPHGTSRATFINDTVYIYETYSGIASFDMETGEYISSLNVYDKAE